MIEDALRLGVLAFFIFCRVGTAFMLLPAFSSTRFPIFVRIIIAIAISVSFVPYLAGQAPRVEALLASGGGLLALITEMAAGLAIGFAGYCYLHAVRFAGIFITNMIGLAGIPGQPIEGSEPSSHVSNLLNLAATALIFSTGLHLLSIGALLETYQTFPVGEVFELRSFTDSLLVPLRDTSLLVLQISSPFIVFTVLVNFALGVAGKMTPRVSTYFALTGAIIMGGVFLLAIAAPQLLSVATNAYGDWLMRGMQ